MRGEMIPLAEVCEINPRLQKNHLLTDDVSVSFVPMAAVDEHEGVIAINHVRPFGEVKKGYTSFREDDVLFAKITPCMENGKVAVLVLCRAVTVLDRQSFMCCEQQSACYPSGFFTSFVVNNFG